MFEKMITTDTGISISAHKVLNIRSPLPKETFASLVESYTTYADYLLGSPAVYSRHVHIPFTALGNNIVKSIEQYLIPDTNGEFFGGSLISVFDQDPLIAAKEKQLILLKAKRKSALSSVDMDQNQTTITVEITAIKDHFSTLKTSIQSATTIDEVLSFVW